MISEFGKNIIVVNVKGYYEINEIILKGIDLIIFFIDFLIMFFKILVLYVSIFLNEDDVYKIWKVIGEFIFYYFLDWLILVFFL